MGGASAQANSNTALTSALPSQPPGGVECCPEGLIRFAIFFDGTGNNAFKDWGAGFKDWAPGAGPQKKPPPTEGAPTNVAKLYNLFKEKGDLEKRYYRIGVGAGAEKKKDEPWGITKTAQQATGKGARSKIDEALEALEAWANLNKHHLAIEKRVDVFGFSRGAAEARDFFNKLKAAGISDKSQGMTDHKLIPVVAGEFATLVEVPAYPRMDGVIFEFLGVFDTVASMGLGAMYGWGNTVAGYDLSVNGRPKEKDKTPDEIINLPLDKKHVPSKKGWVHRTFHCVADDEHRDLFPLEVIGRDPKGRQYKLLPRNMREQSYPGAHSDVGGGYGDTPGKEAKEHLWGLWTSSEVLATYGTLAHIPLRDMHAEAKKGFVPLADLSALGNHSAVDGTLEGLYGKYLALRQRLIEKYVKGISHYADYTRDIVHDPVYLQALPEGIYQKICKERDADPDYQKLAVQYIHTPAEELKWRFMDSARRVVRGAANPLGTIFTRSGRRDINVFTGARQRDVHYQGFQNSYDGDCDP